MSCSSQVTEQAIELVRQVLDLLRRQGWCQNVAMRFVDGQHQHCLIGAIGHFSQSPASHLMANTFCEITRSPSILEWNDHPMRTFKEVEIALEETSRRLEERKRL